MANTLTKTKPMLNTGGRVRGSGGGVKGYISSVTQTEYPLHNVMQW